MNKAKFSRIAAGVALALGTVGAANALTLTAGNYKITLDNYDSGTLYGPSPALNSGTTTYCVNNTAACDAVAGPGPGTPAPGALGGSADTMGILSVALIQNLNNGQIEFQKGTPSTVGGFNVGPYLTGVFGNLIDKTVVTNCSFLTCNTTALAIGGTFAIYNNPADWNPALGPTGAGVNLNGGAMTYPSITPGTSVFLSGVFAPGAVFAGDATASYVTAYDSNTINGAGQGYLDFTGGTALPFFNTNSIANVNGGMNDAYLTTTFDDVNGVASSLGWTVKSVTQVSGLLIPEPGSLALVSLALLGLGLAGRRSTKR